LEWLAGNTLLTVADDATRLSNCLGFSANEDNRTESGQQVEQTQQNGEWLVGDRPGSRDESCALSRRTRARRSIGLCRVAVFLADVADEIAVTHRAAVLADEPDNRILECAVSGKADAIVTGDKATLRLGRYEDVPIITLREFLAK